MGLSMNDQMMINSGVIPDLLVIPENAASQESVFEQRGGAYRGFLFAMLLDVVLIVCGTAVWHMLS